MTTSRDDDNLQYKATTHAKPTALMTIPTLPRRPKTKNYVDGHNTLVFVDSSGSSDDKYYYNKLTHRDRTVMY